MKGELIEFRNLSKYANKTVYVTFDFGSVTVMAESGESFEAAYDAKIEELSKNYPEGTYLLKGDTLTYLGNQEVCIGVSHNLIDEIYEWNSDSCTNKLCKCGNAKCTGFYLLHPKELEKIPDIKETELANDPECTFNLIDSPSSGEIYVKFKELHVIGSCENKKI